MNKQIHDLQKIKVPISIRTIIGYVALYLLMLPIAIYISERYSTNIILYLYLTPLIPVIGVSYLLFTGKLALLIRIIHKLTIRR